MARKKTIHPSLRIDDGNEAPDDDDIYIGGLEHGAAFEDNDYEDDEDEDDDDDVAPRGETAVEKRLAALEEENARLRRSIPPVQPRAQPDPEPEPEPNWDELIFTDPGKALKLHGEAIRKQVTAELKGEYNRDQSTARFWNDFYKTNNDLSREDDHDMVNTVLQSNMASLADLPTDQAIVKLGDLTRQRIMRYSKQPGTKRVRRMAEGASAPTPVKKTKADDGKVTSISDIIKARKQKRISAA